MTALFLDASAFASFIIGEDDKGPIEAILRRATLIAVSPVVLMETMLAVRRGMKVSSVDAEEMTTSFVGKLGMEEIAITVEIGAFARSAYARFGKGSGHPAGLNMGDCFAYAAAKRLGLPLLFKGADFEKTDIVPAR